MPYGEDPGNPRAGRGIRPRLLRCACTGSSTYETYACGAEATRASHPRPTAAARLPIFGRVCFVALVPAVLGQARGSSEHEPEPDFLRIPEEHILASAATRRSSWEPAAGQCIEAGMDRYLSKPHKPHEPIAALGTVMEMTPGGRAETA